MNKNDKTFESSKEEHTISGCIKFTSDYVSKKQLYDAALKWIASDKNVLKASIRVGGSGQHALDFMYVDSKVRSSVFSAVLKSTFEDLLDGDYMIGWDYGNPTYIVK